MKCNQCNDDGKRWVYSDESDDRIEVFDTMMGSVHRNLSLIKCQRCLGTGSYPAEMDDIVEKLDTLINVMKTMNTKMSRLVDKVRA